MPSRAELLDIHIGDKTMKKMIKVFLIFWAVLFVVSFFTAKLEITFFQRVGYTAVMAGFVALLSLGSGQKNAVPASKNSQSRKIRVVDIKVPNSPKVLYQIKRNKVYRNLDPKPIYEIRDNKVYIVNSPKVVYTLSENEIYRNMEPVPIWEIRGNKICVPLSPKVVYEMQARLAYRN